MNATTLRTEREKLTRTSNGLLKKCGKMLRAGNRAGAGLLLTRIEELKKHSLELAAQIIELEK